MTIPASARPSPIPAPNAAMQFTDPRTGRLTSFGIQLLAQWRAERLGCSRVIPCEAVGTNVITLTPRAPVAVVEKYADFDAFAFIGQITSTAAVTARVQPDPDTDNMLTTLKVYTASGAAQAGSGAIVAGLFYIAWYVHSLDSGNGGLVLK